MVQLLLSLMRYLLVYAFSFKAIQKDSEGQQNRIWEPIKPGAKVCYHVFFIVSAEVESKDHWIAKSYEQPLPTYSKSMAHPIHLA